MLTHHLGNRTHHFTWRCDNGIGVHWARVSHGTRHHSMREKRFVSSFPDYSSIIHIWSVSKPSNTPNFMASRRDMSSFIVYIRTGKGN